MADEGEKTEEATPKKRKDARKEGDVAHSKEISSVMLLFAMLLIGISVLGARLALSVVDQARSVWSGQEMTPSSLNDYSVLFGAHGSETGRVLIPALLVLVVFGVLGSVVQVGFRVTPKKLKPKFKNISPAKGIKKLFEFDKLFEMLKAFVKIGVFSLVTWLVLQDAIGVILDLVGADITDGLVLAGALIRRLTIWIIVGFGSFAIVDYAYTRWRYEKKLRMSKQEVRDEAKQREGDPKVKARMRSMAHELSRMRMIAAVGDADVVITNPTHFAIALQYVRGSMRAPKVVAKGRNHLAIRIRSEARKRGIPIVENPPLAQLLYKLAPLGREIPESLFQAVAEVLAYISRLDPRRSKDWRAAS